MLNNIYRAVPTKEVGSADDGLNIRAMPAQELVLGETGNLRRDKIAPAMSDLHFWACLEIR